MGSMAQRWKVYGVKGLNCRRFWFGVWRFEGLKSLQVHKGLGLRGVRV